MPYFTILDDPMLYLNHTKHLLTAALMIVFLLACSDRKKTETMLSDSDADMNSGMQFVKGGVFQMGSDIPEYPTEGPVHAVNVDDFYIDKTEVTNAEFKGFTDNTGYVTTAEIAPTWEELKQQLPPGTPPPDEKIVAGSVVYDQPETAVSSMADYSQWWRWVEGANWKNPEGPASNLKDRWNHPVVHISQKDALAYCQWSGKRLPTEAEWEYASRGGQDGLRFSWGSELQPAGKIMANTFQGAFPVRDLLLDGFSGTAPVKSFEPNAYGLYDMIGNVWEWTSDLYDAEYYKSLSTGLVKNPIGSSRSFDPQEPFAKKYVIKGGSFLCAENYCSNYRPSARQAAAFDSGTSNVGFRCVKTP
jgi:sulfatase modifying factor 1